MTDEELQELRDSVYDYAQAYKKDWETTESEWRHIVEFVNAMLAKREGGIMHPDYIFKSEGKFSVRGNPVYATRNNRDYANREVMGEDLIGRLVEIDGSECLVIGVESFAIGGVYRKHREIALMVGEPKIIAPGGAGGV